MDYVLGSLMGVASIFYFMFLAFIRIKSESNKKCEWTGGGIYKTACKNEFYDATEGHDVTEWATYCPYCSGEIELNKTKG